MELNYSLIGLRIKKARNAKKVTQDKLSEICDISPQHLSQIESGKTKLSLPTLINIANALDVTADALICDVIKKETPELLSEIPKIFDGCSSDEIFLMLSIAENLKKSMRLRLMKK